ncbi:hypothetical protein [Leucobacter chromiireducens]|uniref:hypothetical protein n=1 Tax=Leucobacter chromiireducens TaxID=283877 RepID=UPI000F63A3F4|nr:hypothetical protein [Leucobacter chromiireducens]
MTADAGDAGATARATAACTATAERLTLAGVEAEHLAVLEPPRRVLLWTRPARMREIGRVWRLGTLLLGTDGALYAAGRATRAAERGRPGYQSLSREERREIAAAALRGGFASGAPVNFDATEIPIEDPAALAALAASGPDGGAELPLGLADGEVRVRWRAGAPLAGAQTLAAFLSERAELLRSPEPS